MKPATSCKKHISTKLRTQLHEVILLYMQKSPDNSRHKQNLTSKKRRIWNVVSYFHL